MKKSVIISLGVLLFVIVFCVFLLKNNNYYSYGEDFIGNHSGNIVNAGFTAENDKYIFIASNMGEDIGIFRKSKENGDTVKISEDKALYLNVDKNKIFYVNLNDNGKIYKIDDDGQNKQEQLDFESCEYFSLNSNGAFFEYSEDGRVYNPYKSDNNFNKANKLIDDNIDGLVFYDNYLYYSNWSDGGRIYKTQINQNDKTVLSDSYSSFINIYDDWIYYTNDDDNYKIYKIKTDGSQKALVCGDSCNYVNFYDGFLYYSNESDENKLYKIKTDGSQKTKLSDDDAGFISITNNRIYYVKQSDEIFYSVNFDGSDRQNAVPAKQ